LGRRFRGLIVSASCIRSHALRHVTQDDRNSCGRGATREVLVVPRVAARSRRVLPVKIKFDYRTIPIVVKSKMATPLLTHSVGSPPSNEALRKAHSPLAFTASDKAGFAERQLWNSRQRGRALCGTPHALYSKPFAFRTVWAAGEERNVTSALPASV
jgi:hypothetical protein